MSPVPRLAGPSIRNRRHAAYAATIAALAVLAGYGLVVPVYRSHLLRYLDIGDNKFGLLLSIGALTAMVSMLFGGQLLDRWGPRRMIRISLTGLGVSMLIMACAGQSFAVFVIASGCSGFFFSPMPVVVSAYLGRLFPRHKRRVIALNMATISIGAMVFPIVAESLLHLAERTSAVSFAAVLHTPFLIVGLALFAGSFIYRGKGAASWKERRAGTERRWQWRDLLVPPEALLLGILMAAHATADSTLFLWMPRFLESRSFAGELIRPGLVTSAYALAGLLARALLFAVPDRVGRRVCIVLPGLLGGSLLIVGLLSRSFLLTATSYVLGAFCWSVEYPAMLSTLMHHHRKRFGAAMAVSGVISSLAVFVAVSAMGLLVNRIGDDQMWKLMLLLAAGFPLIGLGGLAWWLRYDRHRRAP